MTIAQHKVVTIQYKVSDSLTGELIDSSENGAPLTYLHGAHNIIPGLEQALEGKAVGDQVEAIIAPEDAYGEYRQEAVQQVPIDAFQNMEKIEPGMQVSAETEQGRVNLVITHVAEDLVTVDANHPLAGKSLKFEVTVEDLRDASEEEKEHGHVHGPDGHEHE